jgi:hypothetical protein
MAARIRTRAALLACMVCAGCAGPANTPVAPSPIFAGSMASPSVGGLLTLEWACVQTPHGSGRPLGTPVAPACAAGRPAAALHLPLHTSVGAAATVVPPATLSASVSGTTVILNWGAPAGAVTSYIIEAGSFPGLSDLATFDTASPVTSAVFFNVGARVYFVRVRARNGADISDPSNEVRLTVEGGNCGAGFYGPFVVHVAGQGSSVSLTWDRPDLGCPATDYIIEAGSSRGGLDLANFRTGSSQTRYDAVGVGAGTYYVRIRAANDVSIGPAFVENILVFGSGCLYSVADSRLFVSRGGFAASYLRIETGDACPWTASGDASWLMPPGGALPASGSGVRSLSMNLNANIGPTRSGTVQVRWAGGGADVPITQNGF